MSVDQKQEKHMPGEEGVWVFVLGDMIIFGLFFLVYLYYRNLDIEVFTSSQQLLNPNYGVINTLLLLTSSWFVAIGLDAIRKKDSSKATRVFALAFLCGVGFSAMKYLEWGEKIGGGYTLVTNEFFMYYYIFTGIHFLHLLIGMGILYFLFSKAKKGQCESQDIKTYESGGVYWHMVDLLWIVLFPLLYLVQ